ncbi:hypothetical protein ONS95_013523 [Cadophora gregata]|uniref:uncharacterized protein n=1 Tax=Cadophora gregata TaxID=51156 RepID=UPI0026DCE14E|nr:uncharacterized protein ONS95_013523 [Cadophora gregata]KAK0099579.1 hypothetical protein ONS96_008081 [Cadophora gregata f. sp. sojae]KAK0116511.1 hypothetical protein ONS95_013523 [Cadophora gregata]
MKMDGLSRSPLWREPGLKTPRNDRNLNELARLIFLNLCKNMEYYISIYGQSKGRHLVLDRLLSAGDYAIQLGKVCQMNLTPVDATLFFLGLDYSGKSEDWGEGFSSAVFNIGDSLPGHLDILLRRIEWVHDRVRELSLHMLHDSEPDQLLDEMLKKRHQEDIVTCDMILEKLSLLKMTLHQRYGLGAASNSFEF